MECNKQFMVTCAGITDSSAKGWSLQTTVYVLSMLRAEDLWWMIVLGPRDASINPWVPRSFDAGIDAGTCRDRTHPTPSSCFQRLDSIELWSLILLVLLTAVVPRVLYQSRLRMMAPPVLREERSPWQIPSTWTLTILTAVWTSRWVMS